MPPATPRLAVIDEPFVHDNGVEEAADDEVVDDTDEPIFSAEVASHLTQLAAAQAALRTNGLLHGRVYNAMTGEPLAGATIVVTRGRDESQAVISDGGGWYQLELPGGTYTVAVYYVDHTTEYGDVYVPSGRSALLFPRLLLLAGDDTFGVSFSSGSTSENVYVID
jgi:hypothetical protein